MLILSLLFLIYSGLSWVLLFRDLWTLEVITTKFYPQFFLPIDRWQSLIETLKLNTVPTFLFILLIGLLFYFYFKFIKKSVSVSTVIICSICFQLIMFFSYPILSTDVLSYILSDRIATVYDQNVWTTKPNNFTQDPYYYLVYPIYKETDWTNMTRIYGGVNQLIYTPVTEITTSVFGADLLANLLSHKIVVMLFAVATMFLIPATIVLFNPLFVIESVGSGHNDIIMLFFTIVGLKVFNKSNYFLAAILLGLATQVKTVPLILFAFLVLKLISELKLQKILVFAFGYSLTVLTIYYFMGINPFDTVTRTVGSINVYWQSLPMIINIYIPALKLIPTIILLIALAYFGVKSLIFREDPIEVFVKFMLVYLLFVLSAYWNWYPIWILTLLPFLPQQSGVRSYVLALTLSSMMGYGTYWLSLRFNYQFSLWPAIMYLTILSGPAVVCLINIKKKYLSR